MKRFSLVVLALYLFGFTAFSQVEREEPQAPANPQIQLTPHRIFGKVIDEKTGRGQQAVSVQLFLYTGNGRDSLIRGSFTKNNGEFLFDNLPKADSFRVDISGIGYNNWSQQVKMRAGNENGIADLGNIALTAKSQVLGNVVITAQQQPALRMGIDRKVFSVDQNITASGGTALEVMRNIPSVSVDAEGNVQLRNASPQIFVDGRPTILTPDQIPADQIERIELITNPSSKFDASSSAGIINIVMKRNRKMGLNGIATVGAGIPSLLNGNLSLNARQGKFNLFVTGGYFQAGGVAKGHTLRQNKHGGVVENYFNQYSSTDRFRRFQSLRAGFDFFASIRNTLSFTQSLVHGRFTNTETQDQQYLNRDESMERYGNRLAESENSFNRYNTQVNFIHRFPQQGKQLTANFNYSTGSGNEGTSIVNTFFYPGGAPYADPARVRNAGSNNNDQYTAELDYTNPLSEKAKLEAGLRTFTNKQRSYFSSFSLQNGT
ncbi:MAG TPA: outer membrane beta-barrel protein, partial [Flavisolibacter sp.]|nr:outer membrane beta-barrel protein [Flavisolibacter sp.]